MTPTGLAGVVLLLWVAGVAAQPQVEPAFAPMFSLTQVSATNAVSGVTQLAIGPDGRLYAARAFGPMVSFARDPVSGALSGVQNAGVGAAIGVAFATHSTPSDPVSRTYLYATRQNGSFEGVLSRYSNPNGDLTWGASGEVNVDLVRGVPIGDHAMNQLAIRGNQLFVGIGTRTMNGQAGQNTAGNFRDDPSGPVPGGGYFNFQGTGFSYGESAYGGTIATIRDLSQVPSTTSAAQLRDGPNGTSGDLLAGRDALLLTNPATGQPNPLAQIPFTSTAINRLVVHSAGTRNGYGIAVGPDNEVYFTNNFGRASATNGTGGYLNHFRDRIDANLADDVHDQLFRATAGANYGYAIAGLPASVTAVTPTLSITPDALYDNRPGWNTLHDPASPVGLGPSSSSNGLSVFRANLALATAAGLPQGERLWALVTRWNRTVIEAAPGTASLTYADLVLVDLETGSSWRVASGFQNPIDVLHDGALGFYIGDFGSGTIYRTGLFPVIPEPGASMLGVVAAAVLGGRRRRSPVRMRPAEIPAATA